MWVFRHLKEKHGLRLRSFRLLGPASPRSCSHLASWRSGILHLASFPNQFRPIQFVSLIKFRWQFLQEAGEGQLLGKAGPGSRKKLALTVLLFQLFLSRSFDSIVEICVRLMQILRIKISDYHRSVDVILVDCLPVDYYHSVDVTVSQSYTSVVHSFPLV